MSKFVEELKKDIEGIEARHEQKKEIRHERHEEKKFARELKHEMLKKYRFIRADIEVLEYKPKKKTQSKFGNNAKSLNKILKQVNKDSKLIETKINKIEQITKQEK